MFAIIITCCCTSKHKKSRPSAAEIGKRIEKLPELSKRSDSMDTKDTNCNICSTNRRVRDYSMKCTDRNELCCAAIGLGSNNNLRKSVSELTLPSLRNFGK